MATAAVLAKVGLPSVVQGYWTERFERSVLPTALAILGVTDSEKDILERWKPEGSDTYVRSYGGRVARLQAKYAISAREDDRYTVLDEREIAANLIEWLHDRRKLGDEAARAIVEPLAFNWKNGKMRADVVPLISGEAEPAPEDSEGSGDSGSEVVQASSSRFLR